MRKLNFILFILITSFSTSALSQNSPVDSKSGIGPRFGYYKAPDADEGTMFLGIQARGRGAIFGGEIAAEYRGEQAYSVTGGELTVRQIPLTGSILVFVPFTPNFQPYGIAGLGAYYTISDYDGEFVNTETETKVNVGYHLGFGLDLPINKSAALNVDYRYLYLDGENDNLEDKQYSGNVITGGLTFYF